MGYKRTSKKTGIGSRRTTTINNSNGSQTVSNSTGNKYSRTTYSNNSKTGNKITQTYRDGAGFTHTKTVYKSPTEAQRLREAKKAQQFWANMFGANKKKRTTNTRIPSTGSPKGGSSGSGGYAFLFIVIVVSIVSIIVRLQD